MSKTNYLIFLLLITAGVYLGFHLANQRQLISCTLVGFNAFIIIVPSLFALFHFVLVAKKKNEQQFIRSFMTMLTLKFLSLLTLLLIGLLINRSQAKCYVLTFLISYGVFLLFETIAIQTVLNSEKKK